MLLADWRCRSSSYGRFGLEWKRHAVWQNDDRNDAIAGIARAMAEADLVKLGDHGIFLDQDRGAIGVKHYGGVAILVESPAHAAAIGGQLTRLAHRYWLLGKSYRAAQIDSQLTGSHRAFKDSRPERMIVTQVGASRCPMSTLDVLIRADGLPWPLEVPDLLAGTRDGEQGQLLVIDLRDDFDEIAVDATRHRLADYHRRGWTVSGGPQIREGAVLE